MDVHDRRTKRLRRALVVSTLLALTGAAGLTACGSGRPDANEDGFGPGTPGYCATRNSGCPCDVPGQVVECGHVSERYGDYVICSEGKQVCVDGKWGSCMGDHLTTRHFSSGASGGLQPAGLATSPSACTNPCDPYCKQYADDPIGLTPSADSGLSVVDGGLTITGTASGPPCTSLEISPKTPPATDLVINTGMSPPAPNTKVFNATLLPAGCYSGPVSALWSVNKFDIAQVVNGTMTVATPIAGPIQVSAYAGALSDSATSMVTVNVVDVTGAPAGYNAASFPVVTGAADTNLEILYPYANTVFPLGLLPPLIQWRDATNPTVNAVKVTLRYPPTGTPIFQWSQIVPEKQTAPTPGLPAQPRAVIPKPVWFAFEQSVTRNAATYGDTAEFGIQRFIGAGPALAEVSRNIKFANGQLKGKILYNSYGTNLVQNYGNTAWGTRFGAATLQIAPYGTVPTVVAGYTSASNGPGCRVCHSVSANGLVLATNRFQPNDKTSSRIDVPSLTESLLGAATGDGRFTWPALSTDGSYLFGNVGPAALQGANTSLSSRLYTTATGALLASPAIPNTLKAATPAFAHDNSAVAFNFYSGTPAPLANPPSGPTSGDNKSLAMMSFDPATRAFSGFRNLYVAPGGGPGTGTASWPSFLPPGQNGVVFHREIRYNTRDFGGTRSDCDGTGACNSQGTTAELWWVNTAGAATPRRLDVLNGWNGATSYLPTGGNRHGNPADATYNDNVYNYEPTILPTTAGGYSWVVFTSRRMYGNVATINPFWSDPRYQNISVQPTTKKLWIAAINSNPAAGSDPSNPAFYLPGQELLAGNSRGYFVLEACKQPGAPSASNVCDTTADCCQSPTPSVCQIDPPPLTNPPVSHCVASGGAGCKADGAACTSDLQCCNFATGVRCASGTCQMPPSIVSAGTPTYTRTFSSNCVTGEKVIWRFFDWITTTPTGTSIDFTARTAAVGQPFGAPVAIGTAIAPPIVTPTWTSAPSTVDDFLKAAGQTSKEQLEVTMTFNPKTSFPAAAPTLWNWRVAFDCVPAE